MRTLACAILVAGCLSQSAACIIIDDGATLDEGRFSLSWTLMTQGNVAGCAWVKTIEANWKVPGAADSETQRFACGEGAGLTRFVAPGTYEVWLYAYDEFGLAALSFLETVTVAGGTDVPVAFQFVIDQGRFEVSWSIVDATTRAAVSCSQAGADKVTFGTIPQQGVPDIIEQFDCPKNPSLTMAFWPAPAEYNVAISLSDLRGTTIDAVQKGNLRIVGNQTFPVAVEFTAR